MGNYIAAINSVVHGIAGSTEVYGAWYEGQQINDMYHLKADLTYRQKQEAVRQIEIKRREARFLRSEADAADAEAGYVEKAGAKKLEMQQKSADAAAAEKFAQMAKSGVAMNFGSPETVLNEIARQGAAAYAWTKFEADVDTWQAQRRAYGMREKANIVIAEADAAQANLPMYDFQAQLFRQAAGDAKRIARYKSYTIALSHISQSLAGFGGGGGGSAPTNGGNQGMSMEMAANMGAYG